MQIIISYDGFILLSPDLGDRFLQVDFSHMRLN